MRFATFVVALGLFLSSKSTVISNEVTPTYNYFLMSKRQLQNDIHLSELRISSADDRSADHLKLIREEHQMVLQDIHSAELRLTSLQLLSPGWTTCVQRYKSLMIKWDVTKEKFASCLYTMSSKMSSMTLRAKHMLKSAKAIVDVDLPKAVAKCNTTFANNPMQLEECVLSNVANYSREVKANLNGVDTSIEAGLCASFDSSREAILCSFETKKTTLITIGEMMGSINLCMEYGSCACNSTVTQGPFATTAIPATSVTPAAS